MSKGSGGRSYVNEGIQGNVKAEVIAVGRHAQATKVTSASSANGIHQAILELRSAIGKIDLLPEARTLLDKDLSELAGATGSKEPDRGKAESCLKGIADKLKMVGIVLRDVAALAEPAKKIAELIGVTLSFLA
jgi:hypothetical protein